ncbi:hypothetical protein Ddye_008051 [Dipteronia dyeriana]|uniref:Uncharacterized protein n=1 Tax=Dipteronia dyeriana TaxID=168575 RepID=A0AAE0CL01_9ROSI|nr:hypothetical protein Ddye_008051 [Dipteronia dyeriana]
MGNLLGEWVENKLSSNELVEMTYRLTGINRIFRDDSLIKEIYIDMGKRVGGGGGAGGGGDAHVHKILPSFFKYNNVGCYTTDSDTEDEKPNEHDYPSNPDDTFVRVEQGTDVEDGIGGIMNCGYAGGVTFGGPSHDPFPVALSRWIIPCVGQYSFGTTPATSTLQEGPLFVGQDFEDKHKLKIELGLYTMQERYNERYEGETWCGTTVQENVDGYVTCAVNCIRPIVAIDAIHLKSDYRGVIFVATCKDGTVMVYPFPFGFGDGETDEAWTWFLLYTCEVISTLE